MKLPVSAAVAAALGAVALCPFARAGSFTADFNSGTVPAGTAVYGNTVVEANGGVGDTGALKITKAVNSQQGSFVIDDLDAGSPVNSVDCRFDLRCGGGSDTPADGWSFCIAPDLPAGGWGEEGIGSGLIVAFDIYDNGGGEAPAITLRFGATQLAEVKPGIAAMTTGANFVPVRIVVEPDASLDVYFNGVKYFDNIYLPYAPMGGLKYGWGGRTGGLNQNQFVDNIVLTTTTGALQPAVTAQPANVTVVADSDATFSVAVNDPTATFQWQKKAPSAATFTDISGATFNPFNYIEAPLADNGTQVRVVVTTAQGSVTSDPATLGVVTLPLLTSQFSTDFEAGVPAGLALFGNATLSTAGGFGDTASVSLTENVNGQSGSAIVADLRAGLPVDGFTASFYLRMGEGSSPPADGFSFNWASDIPDGTLAVAEEGAGTGLSVLFDVYGADAPQIDLKYKGAIVASRRVALDQLQTGGQSWPVIIRLQPDGTVDVAYNGIVYFDNYQLADWSAAGGNKFVFAARTGGLNQRNLIDNIELGTTLYAGPISITDQPDDLIALIDTDATFTVVTNDPSRSTYQWQIKRTTDAAFVNLGGPTTNASVVLGGLTMADNGAQIRVIATGPASTTTSNVANLEVVNLGRCPAPQVNLTFEGGLPVTPVVTLYGNAVTFAGAGTGGTDAVQIVDAVGGQSGAMRIDDYNAGAAIGAVQFSWDVRVDTAGTPADGFALSWATDVPAGTSGQAEEGDGSALRVCFDTYDNGGGEAPAVDIKWGNTVLAHLNVPIASLLTGTNFVPVYVRLSADGKIDVAYNNVLLHHNVQVPGWNSLAGAHFYYASRTGGAFASNIIDNFAIQTTKYVGPVTFTQQPLDTVILSGQTATLSAQVNDPVNTTWQWQVKNPTDASFANIPGATSSSYTTSALTGPNSGTQYRVVATAGNVLASNAATVTVVSLPAPASPDALFTFDDGLVPPGTFALGAYATSVGGVNDSGVLHLTDAVNGVQNAFIVDDLDFGTPVKAFYASFQLRIGGGTVPPADGVSFVWSPGLPTDSTFGEEGAGDGLVVAFDIYDNGGGEAPAITLRWKGQTLGEIKPGIAFMETDTGGVPGFAQCIVRLEEDGTVDVVYKNQVLFYNIALPGWTGSVTAPRFAWGGRTGGLNENQWLDDVSLTTYTTTPLTPPTIDIAPVGANIVITFDGVLQTSPSLGTGTWTNVPGATSPYTVPAGDAARFYRARK